MRFEVEIGRICTALGGILLEVRGKFKRSILVTLVVLRSTYDVSILGVVEACCVELGPLRCLGPGFC